VGDVVFAVGNPLGFGQTVTMGIVSAKGRTTGASEGGFEDFIQTDAPINQGNSGGALINMRGELIGINSQIVSPVGYNIGIGLSIPSNLARRVMDQLVEGGRVRRGLLGVTVQGVTADLAKGLGMDRVSGAIVSDVQPGSPAAKAGVEAGDVILALNGVTIDSSNALRNQVASLGPDQAVTLTVSRNGKPFELRAVLAELPSATDAAEETSSAAGASGYGLSVEPLTPELARQLQLEQKTIGVVVAGVRPGGPAAEAGLQEGDVIEQVNSRSVGSPSTLKTALDATPKDRPAVLLVSREGRRIFVALDRERA
jgi:S1-C subfamily serine protease